ncbi:hypothetical protein [Kiloniella sp. EL199]|uniref:DUF6966 domain-containing protein n=1 Tax=Kiloniella sp. EL199 TaxID=2107581 RepID=UPI000EA17F4E|nr:hypothetical protein [Kiloniella sp. EL199]
MNSTIIEFVAALEDLEGFLNKHDSSFWANKVRRVINIAAQSDGYCIDLFTSYLGGAGSLSDLVIDGPNSINNDFHKKLNRTYQLALAIK